MHLITRAARGTSKADEFLIRIAEKGWNGKRQNAQWVSWCLMGGLDIKSVSSRIVTFGMKGPRGSPMYTRNDRGEREMSAMMVQSISVWLKLAHGARVEHQTAEALSHLPTTGVNISPLDDGVPLLMITKVQPGGKCTESYANQWHSLSCNDVVHMEKYGLPEALQGSDGTDKKRLPTTSEFVTE